MNKTELSYLEKMDLLEQDATILDTYKENDKDVIILDKTIFYPQGGGQPYDTGKIAADSSVFSVQEVRYFEGIVKHIGFFEKGMFEKNQKVSCRVDAERRSLHARLHSGGHLVDMAVYESKPSWIPGKGYHFPDGPYVEYTGAVQEGESENLIKLIEESGNRFVEKNIAVKVKFCNKDELTSYCRHVPDNIPEGKPIRVVLFGNFGVPCGGTHVKSLSEIRKFTIRKIKQEKDKIKVSYEVER